MAKFRNVDICEQVIRGLVRSDEISPADVLTGFHNAMFHGSLLTKDYQECEKIDNKKLEKFFDHLDKALDIFRSMEDD